jgi:hypothetical protein
VTCITVMSAPAAYTDDVKRARKLPAIFSLCLLVLSSWSASAQATLKKLPAPPDTSVPAAIRDAVESSGAQLLRPDGTILCEIWLRKSLSVGRVTAVRGVTYPEMSESLFVGVISFPNGGKDFRGQAIKAGSYTMRYAMLPEDGNHMGVAPTRDFVLLVRAPDDTDPNAQYDFGQLVKVSVQAAGTNHPAAFLLLAPEGGHIARTYQNADGYQVFAGALPSANKPSSVITTLSLVVKGQAEQ